jgi:hypothetical protein
MSHGRDDPDADDGKVLAPEELDIADDEHVTQLDEGRFVVSPEARTDDDVGRAAAAEPDPDPEPEPVPDPEPDPEPELDSAAVHEWLREEMDSRDSKYGFDVTAKFDGDVDQQQMMSNDIVTVFESLLLWYARQIDGTTPVEEVLGILLMESNVPVRYPAESLRGLVEATGCDPDDSVAELLAAVGDDGVRF